MMPPLAFIAATIFSATGPLVEAVRAARLDLLQRPDEVGVLEDVAGLIGRAVLLEIELGRRAARVLGHLRLARGERDGLVVAHDDALARQVDGRLDELRPGQLAEPLVGFIEAGDRSRHRDALERQHLVAVNLPSGPSRRSGVTRQRRLAVVLDRRRRLVLGVVDQHVAAAADVAGARQGQRLGDRHRHRRVDGVAALAQDFRPDARGDLVLRHHHAAPADGRVVDRAIADQVAAGDPGACAAGASSWAQAAGEAMARAMSPLRTARLKLTPARFARMAMCNSGKGKALPPKREGWIVRRTSSRPRTGSGRRGCRGRARVGPAPEAAGIGAAQLVEEVAYAQADLVPFSQRLSSPNS